MKPKSKLHNRFHKIANAIIKKQSPSAPLHPETDPLRDSDDDAMGITEEEEAVDQEGKKAKRKPRDMYPNSLF